ncbi:putative lipoprotein [Colwellia psychrerythraea 34H]|uniref:Putative lipoprotein n=1 Tax=Colwellia psychrerythraea (strain 34H / ATCC BAA-681) TaxID=167879 RepID=Q47W76_COLP3|nr:putative lipoprotein [Colwellia psychrerythraea 34H]
MKINFDSIKIITVYISSAVFSIACASFIIGG